MDAKRHEFFASNVRRFNDMAGMLREIVSGLSAMEAELVQFDNDYESLSNRCKTKQKELDEISKKVRERSIMVDAGFANIKEQLYKEKSALTERESKLRVKEHQVIEAQKKADELLAAIELRTERKRMPIGA